MHSLRSLWSTTLTRFQSKFPNFYAKLPAFAELARLDKPIGIYLLLWPTIGALWLAAEGVPPLSLLFIFATGTAVMRSAGCCINDFADYRIDSRVTRTRQRPLVRAALDRRDAMACFITLSLTGFALVLLTNQATILLSLVAIVVVVIYPFMKRFTNLPQIVLGIAFSWGILMAFTAQTGAIPQSAYLLFVANCLWTVAYDTQYAMADRASDIEIGVKSSAILFGDADKPIIASLQVMFILAMWLAGRQFELNGFYTASLVIASALLCYQHVLIKDRLAGPCFEAFLNNNWVGAVIFTGIVLGSL